MAIVDPSSYYFSLEYILNLIDKFGSDYYSLIDLKGKTFENQEDLRNRFNVLQLPIRDNFYEILSGALVKKTRSDGRAKNAIKLFEEEKGKTEEDALLWLRESGESEHAIEYRCSVPETCMNFCNVREYCHYWQKRKEEIFKK